eukprot:scaffold570_cov169-Alexandrium_tamarense.AAC.23
MSIIPRRSHFILQRFSSSTAIKSMVVSAGANPTSSTLTNVSSSASPPMTQVDVPSSTLPSLTLYGDLNMRPFRNIWMLEELSIPYKHILCKPWSRIAKSVHPMGKVPALLVEYNNGESTTDDGVTTKNSFVVLESAAINTFVGDLSREYNNLNNNPNQTPILVPPPATRERAKYDSLAFFIMTEIDFQSLWIHRKHSDMSDVFGEAPVAVTEAKRQFDNALEAVESELICDSDENCFLLPTGFSAVDILLTNCCFWAMQIGWLEKTSKMEASSKPTTYDGATKTPIPTPKPLSPKLELYLKCCQSRPAFVKANDLRKAQVYERKNTRRNQSSKL